MINFIKLLKDNATAITSIFSIIAAVGGATLYVETNYANAADVKSLAKNQEQILKSQTTQQRQMSIFQLEYYDDKIRKLQEEKRIAEERERTGKQSRAVQKTSFEIQEEINDLKTRREIVRKTLEQ